MEKKSKNEDSFLHKKPKDRYNKDHHHLKNPLAKIKYNLNLDKPLNIILSENINPSKQNSQILSCPNKIAKIPICRNQEIGEQKVTKFLQISTREAFLVYNNIQYLFKMIISPNNGIFIRKVNFKISKYNLLCYHHLIDKLLILDRSRASLHFLNPRKQSLIPSRIFGVNTQIEKACYSSNHKYLLLAGHSHIWIYFDPSQYAINRYIALFKTELPYMSEYTQIRFVEPLLNSFLFITQNNFKIFKIEENEFNKKEGHNNDDVKPPKVVEVGNDYTREYENTKKMKFIHLQISQNFYVISFNVEDEDSQKKQSSSDEEYSQNEITTKKIIHILDKNLILRKVYPINLGFEYKRGGQQYQNQFLVDFCIRNKSDLDNQNNNEIKLFFLNKNGLEDQINLIKIEINEGDFSVNNSKFRVENFLDLFKNGELEDKNYKRMTEFDYSGVSPKSVWIIIQKNVDLEQLEVKILGMEGKSYKIERIQQNDRAGQRNGEEGDINIFGCKLVHFKGRY